MRRAVRCRTVPKDGGDTEGYTGTRVHESGISSATGKPAARGSYQTVTMLHPVACKLPTWG